MVTTASDGMNPAAPVQYRRAGAGLPPFARGMAARPGVAPRCRAYSGSVAVELVLLSPLAILFLLLGVGLGRDVQARSDVAAAARAGAEAAAVATDPSAAQAAAAGVALPAARNEGLSCASMNVSTDTSDFVPGGVVRVHVACTLRLSDLDLPGFPGSVTVTASGSAPIDPYREVEGA